MAKILVVDDEVEIASILETFLIKKGYEVAVTSDPQKALSLVRQKEHFDLIVLDIKMPDITGVDILREMKAVGNKTPVVVLSGSIGLQENEKELRELGFNESNILDKPIDLDELLNAVNERLIRPGG